MITLDFTADQEELDSPTEFKLIWGEEGESIYYSSKKNDRVGQITNQYDETVGILKSEIQPLIKALKKLEELMD